MSKKLIVFFLGIIFFSSCGVASASPVISEIMYDLDGSDIDWVEIYNGDSTDVDLTTLKLLISNSTSNHGIVSSSGSAVLHQGDYGVVVPTSQLSSFTAKWGSSGNIFTSAYTLSNDTGKIEINNGDKNSPIDSVNYNSTQGATGDGKSLQIVNGVWVASTPTPGAANQASSSNNNNTNITNNTSNSTNTDTSTTGGSGASAVSYQKPVVLQKIKTEIVAKPLAYVGIPFQMEGKVFVTDGGPLYNGRYFWNFGDGDSREVRVVNTDKFTHTYFYTGDYTVIFAHYPDSFADTPDATSQMIIKVIPASVSISRVGDVQDFFVELTNNADYPVNISNWLLSSNQKVFTIPHDTTIGAQNKIIIPGKVTNFSFFDKNDLKLMNSQKDIVYSYANYSSFSSRGVGYKNATPKPAPILSFDLENKIGAENLRALAINSGATDGLSDNTFSSFYVLVLSLIFIGAGATAVYFIRRKKVATEVGGDFEILDE
ncbi:MAG: lamin tail domain-containing protein [Candidatus Paceibacterota bacterium]